MCTTHSMILQEGTVNYIMEDLTFTFIFVAGAFIHSDAQLKRQSKPVPGGVQHLAEGPNAEIILLITEPEVMGLIRGAAAQPPKSRTTWPTIGKLYYEE